MMMMIKDDAWKKKKKENVYCLVKTKKQKE